MVTVIVVIIGILLGMSFAGGLAYLVSSIILMKSVSTRKRLWML